MGKSNKSKRVVPCSRQLQEALTGIEQVKVVYSLSATELQARDVDRKLALLWHVYTATVQ